MSCCANKCGPGYSSPKDAFLNGPREKFLFTTCVRPGKDIPDYLAIVDVDPESLEYSKVVARVRMPNTGDELHHTVSVVFFLELSLIFVIDDFRAGTHAAVALKITQKYAINLCCHV